MPTATFPLADLATLTTLTPDELMRHAFSYGLDAVLLKDALEVEVTAERPDLLASEGFARALTVYTGQKRSLPEALASSGRVIRVAESVIPLRPHIAALVVEGMTFTPESLEGLIQFQEKVNQTFGRQRQKSAIGVYNLEKIQGQVTYEGVASGTVEFVPLGGETPQTAQTILNQHPKGVQYAHTLPQGDQVPLLRDEGGQVLALPPIINGAIVGEVGLETQQLLIDVTGTSAKAVQDLANILAHNFLDRGAIVKTVLIQRADGDLTTPSLTPQSVPFSAKFLNEMIGTYIPKPDLGRYLARLDLQATGTNLVDVPSYRTDILSEIDLAGDLLAAVGLENLKPDFSDFHFSTGTPNPLKAFGLKVGDWAQRMGLLEVKTYILTDPELLQGFVANPQTLIQASNARSRSHSVIRPTLQAGLLEILSHNINAPKPISLYEVGDVVVPQGDGSWVEALYWGFACLDSQASFTVAKSYVQTLLNALNQPYALIPYDHSLVGAQDDRPYIPHRAATLIQGNTIIGHFGEIHPEILEQFFFPEPVCAGEINCSALVGAG